MNFYETERLMLRHIEPGDLDDFAAIVADPEVVRYMDDGQPLDRATTEKWIGVCQQKYQNPGFGTSAIIEKSTGRFIGFCGVVRAPDNDFYEVIYGLEVAAWGKGYATEAARGMVDYVFGNFDLDKIYATIYAQNTPSRHIMEKIGFRFLREEPEDDGAITAWYVIDRPADGKNA